MALVDSTPQQSRPFLGDAPRRARTVGAAGETLRRQAVTTLTAGLARPVRLARQIGALLAANVGLSLITSVLLPPAGAARGSSVVPVLVGLALLAGGVLLAIGPVVEGQRTTRALQAWLAPGASDRSRVPSLTELLRPVGLVRLVGCGLLVLGILAGLLTGFGVLGGSGASGGTGGLALVGPSGPAALVGTLPAVVTVVLAATATLRLERGRRGRAPQEDASERAAAFAPAPAGGAVPGGLSTPQAPGPAPAAVPWGMGDVAAAQAWEGTAVAPPTPSPPPADPVAPPAVVTGVPVLNRPAPLPPGRPHPLPATTTEPGPVPGWTSSAENAAASPTASPAASPAASSSGSSSELPEATIARTDLPEHTIARPDLLRPRPLAVVLDDGVTPVALTPGRWLLGRAPAARPGEDGLLPLVVKDGSVSKTHLLVEVGEHVVSVTDRASSNGTHLRWAGGRRRLAAWQATAVVAGESVEVGAITIRVETATPPSA